MEVYALWINFLAKRKMRCKMNDMTKTCSLKDCVMDTPVQHLPTCSTSGANACKDYLHKKEHWTQADRELLGKVLNNYAKQ